MASNTSMMSSKTMTSRPPWVVSKTMMSYKTMAARTRHIARPWWARGEGWCVLAIGVCRLGGWWPIATIVTKAPHHQKHSKTPCGGCEIKACAGIFKCSLETFCTGGATRTPRLTTTNMGWNQHVGDICKTTTATLCIIIHLQITLAVELQVWRCSLKLIIVR
jgi:hypothetical protein